MLLMVAVGASLGLREVTHGFDGPRAAMGVATGYLAGCLAAGYALYRQFGAPLAWLTIARVAIAGGAVVGVTDAVSAAGLRPVQSSIHRADVLVGAALSGRQQACDAGADREHTVGALLVWDPLALDAGAESM
jgi:hypothetical protein